MELISAREAARASGWPERRIRQMVARKELRHLRVGRRILLPDNAVAEYIAQNMNEPDSFVVRDQLASATSVKGGR